MTIGAKFVQDKVWQNPATGRYELLLGDHPRTVDPGFLQHVEARPSADNSTHYTLPIRKRFVELLKTFDAHDRLVYCLNQLLPWDIIEMLVPESYVLWKEKLDRKAEATALNERNRLARLERKEIAAVTANKSVSQAAREIRALQQEEQP